MIQSSTLQKLTGLMIAMVLSTTAAWSGAKTPPEVLDLKDETVKVVSANNILGYDVFDTYGHKVGDLVNFVLDLSEAPRLTHVIVMTGGFIDVGGTLRAVPAEAISWNGERYVLSVDDAIFMDATVLPDNLERFFSRSSNIKQVAGDFGVEPRTMEGDILFYDEIEFYDIESTRSGNLGYLTDVYLSVDNDLAPYVVMAPTDIILDNNTLTRYAVPTTELVRVEEPDLVFEITVGDLRDADMTESLDGITARQAERGLAYKVDLSQ
jgi:sporulation protein YlmC with PRC-barrel domain